MIDDIGLVYKWEKDLERVTRYDKITSGVINVSCQTNQAAFVTTKGKVVGFGDLLNGEIEGIDNAVKSIVLNDKIVILTTEGKVLEYAGENVIETQITSKVIDIEGKENSIMYQTVDEEVYENGTKVTNYGENAFGIGTGNNNTYIIENTGNVYASGENNYGSLGNGTRDDSEDYTIVGNRILNIEPENKAMKIGETEDLSIELIQFNVFEDTEVPRSDFEITSDNSSVVSVNENGRLEGVSEGTAYITVKDKVTGKEVKLKRVVERELTDDVSILKITASSVKADNTVEDITAKLVADAKMTYEVEVTEFTDISKVKIELTEGESEISIDGKQYVKKQDEKDITLDKDVKNVKFIVKSEAGTIAEYTLIIRKVEWEEPEINIVEIYAQDGDKVYKSKKIDDENYEIKVPYDLSNVDVIGITEYVKDKIQIANTGIWVQNKDRQGVTLTGDETIVSIKVQLEDGTAEKEITVKVIKMSTNVNLEKIEVDGNLATLGEDGKYHYYLTSAKTSVEVKVVAEVKSPIEAYVNIENTVFELYETTKQVDITAKQTEVNIKVKAEDGSIKNYALVIEGLPDDATIEKVEVNGVLATYIEGKNRYEIRSHDTEFNVEVTLSDLLATMELGSNEKAIGKDNITVTKTGQETIVKVKVTSQNGLETEIYTIAILEQSANTNLDVVTVNGKIVSPDVDGIYREKVINSTTDINVEAKAEDTKAITQIDGEANTSYIAKKTETVVDGKTVYEYEITVTAEDRKPGKISVIHRNCRSKLRYIKCFSR